ncbi:MAG: aminoglycoside 3'-phosphotransferase, partial [Dactylosporangium sp.]|nr:aminoglycoside 3'-phosphotransferase [Dactylosporangium sp.]
MIAGVPPADVAIPRAVSQVARGAAVRPVWRNERGGLTVQLGTGPRVTPVPRVLEHGADADGAWLVTAVLPGESAVTSRWTARPVTAATAIGRGLRALHDRLPVDRCP